MLLEAATCLLESEPAMRVTEIAFRCGFQSSQYFSNVFRDRHGHTPSDHRKRAFCSGIPNGSAANGP